MRNRQRTDNSRSQRVGELLIEFVSRLLARTLNDSRIREVTLTGVDVRPDLKHARIYFTVRDGESRKDDALEGLRGATGFIRGRMAADLKLRFVPAIEFVYDETPDRARRIDDLLSDDRTEGVRQDAMHLARSGILLVDKPEGLSSARVVAVAKRITGARKVGHLGTLDPFACGPVAAGRQ